jgi:hypothetical protein
VHAVALTAHSSTRTRARSRAFCVTLYLSSCSHAVNASSWPRHQLYLTNLCFRWGVSFPRLQPSQILNARAPGLSGRIIGPSSLRPPFLSLPTKKFKLPPGQVAYECVIGEYILLDPSSASTQILHASLFSSAILPRICQSRF